MKSRSGLRNGQIKRSGRRSGFTLIELLVVIAIIGVLAGLILPGVQAARAAARRAECLNHLRNLGTAMHNHAAQKGYLPAAGRWDAAQWPTNAAPTAGYTEWQNLMNPGTAGVVTMRYSWCLDLLPFLERSDIFDQWDFGINNSPTPLGLDTSAPPRGGFGSYWINDTPKRPGTGNLDLANTQIRVFTCPADATTIPGRGNLSYAVNGGYSWHWRLDYMTTADGLTATVIDRTNVVNRRFSDNLKHTGVFFTQTSKEYKASFNPPSGHDDQRDVTLESIKDGTGTTIMIAENINVGPGAVWEDPTQYPSNWACPHPWNTSFFVNGATNGLNVLPGVSGYAYANGNVRGLQAPPLTPGGREGGINGDLTGANEGTFPYPNSGHTGIVNVLMCDGSARAINESIDARTWARLVSSNGNRMVNPATGVANGVAQENASGIGFTQNPISGDF